MRLLVTVVVNGVTYYGSKEGFAGENFYQDWVKRLPSLELGPVEDSGKIGTKFGNLTIVNDHLNSENPFSLKNYEDLINIQRLYVCTIKWGEDSRNLFDGQLFLQSITDTDITFALTDREFSLGARPFTLTESFTFVEGVNVTNGVIEITANNHELAVGSLITFERMTTFGTSLQYSGVVADNFFYVGAVTGVNTFTILDKDFIPVTSVTGSLGSFSTNSADHRVGLPLRVPFSWGVVREQTPVIKKKDVEVANPDLELNSSTNPILIREDGVLIYSTVSDTGSNLYSEYWGKAGNSGVAPTDDVITLNRQTTGGVLSISGISKRGGSVETSASIQQFFTYVAAQLGLTINTDLI